MQQSGEKLVSIVLPIYNGEKYMEQSIDSVIDQTYKNWELIIIDDCSTDSTPIIAKKYVDRDHRVKYYRNEQNLKLPKSLNRGFSLAKGDYLTWTSDDNLYKPHALYNLVKYLQEKNVDFVYASCDVIDKDSNIVKQMIIGNLDKRDILCGNCVGACFMYTRRVYEQIGEYNPDKFLVEDYDYWLRIFSEFDVYAITIPLYMYRVHDGSLTSTERKEKIFAGCERIVLEHACKFGKLSGYQNYKYYSNLNELSQLKSEKKERNKYKSKVRQYYVYHLWYDLLKKLFDLERYKNRYQTIKNRIVIKKNRKRLNAKEFSIISQNCIAGVLYHDMGMQFLTPTVNLFFKTDDFIKFVQNLKHYLDCELFVNWGEEYPIGTLDDIKIYFMHYSTCSEAEEAWNRRKKRINFDKIFVLCTDMEGFNETLFEQWKKIKYPKLLLSSKDWNDSSCLYLKKYRYLEHLPNLIDKREFYIDSRIIIFLNNRDN